MQDRREPPRRYRPGLPRADCRERETPLAHSRGPWRGRLCEPNHSWFARTLSSIIRTICWVAASRSRDVLVTGGPGREAGHKNQT